MEFIKTNMKWVVIIGIVVVVALWAMSSYNSFVTMGEKIDGQWAQVENQLQRRFDLIPNLQAVVKGLTAQEQAVFLGIADARTKYATSVNTNEKAALASQIESGIGRLLVIMENYPVLQSSQAFQAFSVSLEGTENRLAVERMNYNNLVRDFNTAVKRFPTFIMAAILGVDARSYFEIAEGADAVPVVEF